MRNRFDGILPFVSHRVQLRGSREEIMAVLDRYVSPWPSVKNNFALPGQPRQLQGILQGDRFHITASGMGWNSGQVVLHGCIRETGENGCQCVYRIVPNNYELLFIGIVLCFWVICIVRTNTLTWGLFPLLASVILGLILSGISAVQTNDRLNEKLTAYLQQ